MLRGFFSESKLSLYLCRETLYKYIYFSTCYINLKHFAKKGKIHMEYLDIVSDI